MRRRREHECRCLLQEVTPISREARAVELERDRQLAPRFRPFSYVRDDELGLSRIIADLLDPAAGHGQGVTFLVAMLELLGETVEASDRGRRRRDPLRLRNKDLTLSPLVGSGQPAAAEKIRVVQERHIPEGRRIDITVDIPTDEGFFCLAFENKPYAGDQPEQCRDYLEFLDREYGGRFLLVYMPHHYRLPDESSLSSADRERWGNRFRVLPYWSDDGPCGDDDPSDGNGGTVAEAAYAGDDAPAEDDAPVQHAPAHPDGAGFRDGASLAEWFGRCRLVCDAERLRWFLREAQLFCQYDLGGSAMTDTEARYIREYLEENPKHLHAASAVARAWPDVMHDVCRRFLERLREQVEERLRVELPEIADDLDVGCHYGRDENWSNWLRVYRRGWRSADSALDRRTDGRTAVMLESRNKGPASWTWGVRSAKKMPAMTGLEKKRRQDVEAALKQVGLSRADNHCWPHHESPRFYGNWTALVPELAGELAAGDGKITDYYVNGLLNIARRAIPAIDEIELEARGPSASEDP